jgi:hypothetical protein
MGNTDVADVREADGTVVDRITVRDLFAGLAMHTIWGSIGENYLFAEDPLTQLLRHRQLYPGIFSGLATVAYRIADTMLVQRDKPDPADAEAEEEPPANHLKVAA